MPQLRTHKATVTKRAQRDNRFAKALYTEAVNALLEGETAEGLSMLRDLVNARLSFGKLAAQTGYGGKSLHRMLSRRGNPTVKSMGTITSAIADDLGWRLHVA